MTLKAIHGKPRSGKTCYCVSLIMNMLSDWAEFERREDKPFPRRLVTNIPLHVEAINERLSKDLGFEVDLTDRIVLLNSDFFFDPYETGRYREWWESFETGDFIVIDEVHHYLPASARYKRDGMDYCDKFTQYVSMHGHRQHDLILLTQHIDNVNVEVKKQIETIYEVLNVKSQKLRFPLSIPMEDIDVVREAWGCPQQLAHIRRGVCESRRVVYDKAFEIFVLTPSLFSLYRSHTMSGESLDRPSLKLGRWGSLRWFAWRHVRPCPRTVRWNSWAPAFGFRTIWRASVRSSRPSRACGKSTSAVILPRCTLFE